MLTVCDRVRAESVWLPGASAPSVARAIRAVAEGWLAVCHEEQTGSGRVLVDPRAFGRERVWGIDGLVHLAVTDQTTKRTAYAALEAGEAKRVSAAILASLASRAPRANPDPLAGARRRTDDNLRRVFGG